MYGRCLTQIITNQNLLRSGRFVQRDIIVQVIINHINVLMDILQLVQEQNHVKNVDIGIHVQEEKTHANLDVEKFVMIKNIVHIQTVQIMHVLGMEPHV